MLLTMTEGYSLRSVIANTALLKKTNSMRDSLNVLVGPAEKRSNHRVTIVSQAFGHGSPVVAPATTACVSTRW